MELRNRSLPCWTTSIAELQAGIAKLQFEQGSTSQQKDWQAFHTFDEVSVSHLREVSVSHLRRVRTSISDGQLLVDSVAPGRRCVSDPFILLPAVLPSICDATSTAIYMCSVLCLYVLCLICLLYLPMSLASVTVLLACLLPLAARKLNDGFDCQMPPLEKFVPRKCCETFLARWVMMTFLARCE